MYYGNPAAEDASDGDATMFFLDEFNGNSLDATKWSATGNYVVGGNHMTTSLGGFGCCWVEVGLAREFALAHFRLFPIPQTLTYVHVIPGEHYVVLGDELGATSLNGPMVDLWVDHVFVRNFAQIDPTATVGNEEVAP